MLSLLNGRNSHGETALHLAAKKGHANCIHRLLEEGAKINGVDGFGRTAIFYAVQKDHIACLRLLFNNKAKIMLRDDQGMSPLDIAASSDKSDAVLLLLSALRMTEDSQYKNIVYASALRNSRKNSPVSQWIIQASQNNTFPNTLEKGYSFFLQPRNGKNRACINALLEGIANNKKDGAAIFVANKFIAQLKNASHSLNNKSALFAMEDWGTIETPWLKEIVIRLVALAKERDDYTTKISNFADPDHFFF